MKKLLISTLASLVCSSAFAANGDVIIHLTNQVSLGFNLPLTINYDICPNTGKATTMPSCNNPTKGSVTLNQYSGNTDAVISAASIKDHYVVFTSVSMKDAETPVWGVYANDYGTNNCNSVRNDSVTFGLTTLNGKDNLTCTPGMG